MGRDWDYFVKMIASHRGKATRVGGFYGNERKSTLKEFLRKRDHVDMPSVLRPRCEASQLSLTVPTSIDSCRL